MADTVGALSATSVLSRTFTNEGLEAALKGELLTNAGPILGLHNKNVKLVYNTQ